MNELFEYTKKLKYELRFLKKNLLADIVETYQKKIDLRVEQKENPDKILLSLPKIEDLKEKYYLQYNIDPNKKNTLLTVLKVVPLFLLELIYFSLLIAILFSLVKYLIPLSIFQILPNLKVVDSIICVFIFISSIFLTLSLSVFLIQIFVNETKNNYDALYFKFKHVHVEKNKLNKISLFYKFEKLKKFLGSMFISSFCLLILFTATSVFSNGFVKMSRAQNSYINKKEFIPDEGKDSKNIHYSGKNIIVEFVESDTSKIEYFYDTYSNIKFSEKEDAVFIDLDYQRVNNLFFKEKTPKIILYYDEINELNLKGKGFILNLEKINYIKNIYIADNKTTELNISNSTVENIKIESSDIVINSKKSTFNTVDINTIVSTISTFKYSNIENFNLKTEIGTVNFEDSTVDYMDIKGFGIGFKGERTKNKEFQLENVKKEEIILSFFDSDLTKIVNESANIEIHNSNIKVLNLKVKAYTMMDKSKFDKLEIDLENNELSIDECTIQELQLKHSKGYVKIEYSTIVAGNIKCEDSLLDMRRLTVENITLNTKNTDIEFKDIAAKNILLEAQKGKLKVFGTLSNTQKIPLIETLRLKLKDVDSQIDKNFVLDMINE